MKRGDVFKIYTHEDTPVLLAGVLGMQVTKLYLMPEVTIPQKKLEKFIAFYNRRLRGEPVAYILGYKYFMGRKFLVGKSVLIPRPETEILVKLVLSEIGTTSGTRVIDVGTGSGCIAISLQLAKPDLQVTAVDVSQSALVLARKNAVKLHSKIKFQQSNLLKNVIESFDIYVANLPYVPRKDYSHLQAGLKFEPKNALVSPRSDDWLIFELLRQVTAHNKQALVLLEIDPSYTTQIKKHFPQAKFYKDFQGFIRFCKIPIS
ncbi:MAG TPA: peptide chain release factor N(5)-glutamine methyltransferase [Patescibacteria group bacterium]|nr:peptide chain release factor N(5)-glutamine methyltransferase [Patescibacteria group bacterium]